MWIMLGMSVPAIVCTFSRGAWLGLAAAIGLILIKSKYKVLIGIGGAACVLSVMLFLPFLTAFRRLA